VTTSPRPSTTTTGTTTTSSPKTGDDTNNIPWVVLLSVTVIGLAACVSYLISVKKRRQR
jgi:hypothetical protein